MGLVVGVNVLDVELEQTPSTPEQRQDAREQSATSSLTTVTSSSVEYVKRTSG